MTWNIDGAAPVYLQLADSIRYAIICGEFPKGSRIASVRELSSDAKVNPNTMQRALFELEREGLIMTHGTSGKFVTGEDSIIAAARQSALSALTEDLTKRAAALGFTAEEVISHIRERSTGE